MKHLVLGLLLRVAAAILLLAIGFNVGVGIGKDFPNPKENLAGQLSACNEVLAVFKAAGQLSPIAICEEYKGKMSLTYQGHPEAPRYHLNGTPFN
jgi:hypothetical protein